MDKPTIQDLHLRQTHPVKTFEVDFANRLKVSTLFQYMQEAASKSADRLGWGYDDLIKEGFFWVLSRVRVDILETVHVEETVEVDTWPKGIEGLFATRDFRMTDGSGRPTAVATTSWALLDSTSLRPVPTAELQRRFLHTDPASAIAESLGKIADPPEKELVYEKHVRYLDIDINQHVNNVRYVEFILDSFALEQYRSHAVASLQINYLSEAKFGDTIRIFHGQAGAEGPATYVEGLNQREKRVFQAQIAWRLGH